MALNPMKKKCNSHASKICETGKTHKSLAIKASLVTYVQSPWIGSNQQTLDSLGKRRAKEEGFRGCQYMTSPILPDFLTDLLFHPLL